MRVKIGWVLSVLPCLLLLWSAFMKLNPPPEALEGMAKQGLDAALLKPLAILEATCTILFLIPRTSFIGAILLTGYMGGAIMTHLRMGDNFMLQTLIPIIIWVGFSLRHYEEVLPLLGMRKPHS